jgi:cytoskeletal protein CcmA (bactofilin family)
VEAQETLDAQKTIDTLIGAGTSVLGNVTFTGGLRIDGKVLGNIIAVGAEPCTLVIGEHAEVQGEIRASHVVVNGKVVGPVLADGYVELQPRARVVGDVSYKNARDARRRHAARTVESHRTGYCGRGRIEASRIRQDVIDHKRRLIAYRGCRPRPQS